MSSGAPKRMHPSGRLTFRNNVRPAQTSDLPCVEAGETAIPWTDLIPAGHEGDIEIEIGCGKGTFLLEAARLRPSVHFIGVEAGREYARYCADRIARAELSNAIMVADDARLLFEDSVPEASLARLHVYYPDPWPKRRHRKRRIFDQAFVTLAKRALRPGAELLVATDNSRYFGEIVATLGPVEGLDRSKERERGYGEETPGLAFGPTNFSEKYVAEGRARHRAVYVKTTCNRSRIMDQTQTNDTGTEGWVRAAKLEEIPTDEGLAITCDGHEVALFRDGDGVACLEDSCPHRGAALAEGKVQDGEVICPWHGWRYSLQDGECQTLPGSMPAKKYDVRLEGGEIFIKV